MAPRKTTTANLATAAITSDACGRAVKRRWIGCGLVGVVLFLCGLSIGYYTNRGPVKPCNLAGPGDVSAPETTQPAVTPSPDAVDHFVVAGDDTGNACQKIEEILIGMDAVYDANSADPNDHIAKADLYSKLANRGCPKSRAAYKQKAVYELEVARGLSDDSFSTISQVDVIDVYKKLDMTQEAEAFFDKMQRLTDPAIDFIMEIERVLGE